MLEVIVACVIFLCSIYYIFIFKPSAVKTSRIEKPVENIVLSSQAATLRESLRFAADNYRVTISVEKVLLEGTDKMTADCVSSSQMSAILPLCEFGKVYLLVKADSDAEEEYCRKVLLGQMLTGVSVRAIPCHRMLFYSTEIGKNAIIRQIQPHVHIDGEQSTCEAMNKFVKVMVQVSKELVPSGSARWFTVQSLDGLNTLSVR